MQKRMKRLLCLLAVVILTMCCFALPATATGDVAGAVQSTWTSAQAQIKAIANMASLSSPRLPSCLPVWSLP